MASMKTPRHENIPFTKEQATALLGYWLGREAACREVQPLEGGICSAVFRLTFDRPPYAAVVKLQSNCRDNPLPRESARLAYLRQHTNVPCPTVYLEDHTANVIPYPFLLLEFLPGTNLESAQLSPEQRAPVERELADVLLELHSHKAETFHDAGEEPGIARWVDVFLPCLEENRHDMSELLPGKILEKIDAILPLAEDVLRSPERPTLIHGDLWAGNIMVRQGDDGWHLSGLVDPVGLQYAEVEKELAYLQAFDTVGENFFRRYTQRQPFRAGYELRKLFYWANIYMTHLWLGFGPTYKEKIVTTCDQIIAEYSAGGNSSS